MGKRKRTYFVRKLLHNHKFNAIIALISIFEREIGMKDIKNVFKNGAEGYAPAVMWFTSGNINKEEMTYQLEGFRRAGIRDFFIHASNGTEGDYLGEHFFSMIDHAVSEAKRLDMRFWIYDEYNWPSGIAGGQVLRDAPWARSRRLIRMCETVGGGETLRMTLPSRERYDTVPLLFLCDGRVADVHVDGDAIEWRNESESERVLEIYLSKWIMGLSFASIGSEVVMPHVEGCLDTLDREAVKVFIDKTHEEYKRRYGDDFGKYIMGTFSDEVTAYYEMRDADERGLPVLPWSRCFAEKFRERCGYDIIPRLGELMNKSDRKLLIDYWDTVTELFVNGFADVVGEWCRNNGLLFTGHIDAEESLPYAVYGSGDPYEYYRRFDIPGIDTIYSYYRINDYSYNIAPKLASSAARFTGKERVLSETYTVSGWDIRLSDMKRIFNRLALCGISLLQFMGARYNFMPGADSAAMTNNWQNPLFKHYGELTRYMSGVQYFIASTECDADTLVFYPTTTVKAGLGPLPVDIFGGDMNYTFTGIVNSLMNLHKTFEIGYEQVIDSAEVSDGRLRIAGSEYHTVIMPCTEYLRESTYLRLRDFARGGGRVVMINGCVRHVVGDVIYDAEPFDGAVIYECREYEMSGEHVTNFDSYQRAPMGTFTEKLREAIDGMPEAVIRIKPTDGIMSVLRRADGHKYVMIINDNPTATELCAEMLSDAPFRVIRAEDGGEREAVTDGHKISAVLDPFECVVIEVGKTAVASESDVSEWHEAMPRDPRLDISDANTALPDTFIIRGESMSDILDARAGYNPRRVCDIAERISESELVACRGTATGDLPVKAEHDWFGWFPVDKKPITMGETIVCVHDFYVDAIPPVLEMVTDSTLGTVWYLDGEELYPSSVRRVWHYANRVYDLSHKVKMGKNRLVSICTVPRCDKSFPVPCAMLKGDFRVFDDFHITDRAATNELAVWNSQGYACYAGDAVYSVHFDLPSVSSARVVIDTADAVEVKVNGRSAGKRVWQPYELDITDLVTEGDNLVELCVTSTYSNFMYNSNPSGISGVRVMYTE